MLVVKDSVNSKTPGLISDPRDYPCTFDTYFLITLPRRRDQNLNPDLGPNGWALTTKDEDPVQCNVVGEASLCMLASIAPVEDNWKS
jgi:hypothetical protein